LQSKVDDILKPMVIQCFMEEPADPVEFFLEYLKMNHGNRPSVNYNEKMELEFLRKEVPLLQERIQGLSASASTADDKDSDASASGSDDDEDDVFDLPTEQVKATQAKRGPRQSVSAEAFGNWNKKEEFKAPHYEKAEETVQALKARLGQAFMFSNLNPDELMIVLGAMQMVQKSAGDVVIKQGDDGDNLYVVETGKLRCTKVFEAGADPVHLLDYQPGDAFGELSLLYNVPRAATIEALEDSVLWALDRRTFNHIVKDSAQHKREKYEEFLQHVSILQNMDSYERSKLSDAIVEKWFEEGEYVIKEGEQGDIFYLIMSGQAVATKTLEPGKPPVNVANYAEGDYFGERALLKNEPRAANILAKTRLQVV